MNAMMKPAEPRIGIFKDETPESYYQRRLDVASNSGLSVLDNDDDGCPARYFYYITEAVEDEDATAAKDFGKAFHMAFLEPDRFDDVYAVMPQDAPADLRRFRDAKKPSPATLASIDWWDNFTAKNAGKVFLTSAAMTDCRGMAESLRRLPIEFGDVKITGGELLALCDTEVSVYWLDEDTGIQCKLRADLFSEELAFAGDLKSARSASRASFSRAINSRRYHVAHAHYCEGFRAVGCPLKSFALFPVEKARPYVAASWHVDSASEERGWALRQRAMKRLKQCLDTGRWPGYTTTVTPIGIPAYGHYEYED